MNHLEFKFTARSFKYEKLNFDETFKYFSQRLLDKIQSDILSNILYVIIECE